MEEREGCDTSSRCKLDHPDKIEDRKATNNNASTFGEKLVTSMNDISRGADFSQSVDSTTTDNGPDLLVKRLQGEHLLVAESTLGTSGQTPEASNSLDCLYSQLDEHDITEIYLGNNETENAVAALQQSTDIVIEPLEEQIKQEDNPYIPLPDESFHTPPNEEAQNARVSVTVKLENATNGHDLLTPLESGTTDGSTEEKFSNEFSQKRRCTQDEEESQRKRVKLETSETDNGYSNKDNVMGNTLNTTVAYNQSNNIDEQYFGHVVTSSSHRHNSAIDICPPVAIVTPLGLSGDLFKETVSIKADTENEKSVDELKSDINSILESFEHEDDMKGQDMLEKHEGTSSSLKLTDLEFEKFKNDLFAEQSFKTLDGNNWSFGKTDFNSQHAKSKEERRSSVESEIGDFERVLNSFIKRTGVDRSTESEVVSSTVQIPVKRPFPVRYHKHFDHTDPNVVLANSELLRELLEDKPNGVSKGSHKNSVKPGSVDLSFLNKDIMASKGTSLPVSAILKTKSIEPILKSGQPVNKDKNGNTFETRIIKAEPDLLITVPSEHETETERKATEDHGPLSLAEQRRASITLHHKVPSISDLVSASGPLNKMDGDETEALLNELIGSPANDQYRNDFTSPASQLAPPDFKNGFQPDNLYKIPLHGRPDGNGRFLDSSHPFSGQMYSRHDSQRQAALDTIPQHSQGAKGVSDLSNVDFENMPPERRQILAARYGHLLRGRRGMIGPVPERFGHPSQPQAQSLHVPGNPHNPMFPSDIRGPMTMKNTMFMGQTRDVPFENFQRKDPHNAVISDTNDHKSQVTSSNRTMPGAMDDRMRYLMMQQLHRRRMMAQMQTQKTLQNPHDIESMPTNQTNQNVSMQPASYMPQGGPHSHTRFPAQHINYQHRGQCYPFNPRMEVPGSQFTAGNVGQGHHSGQRMFQGHPSNIYHRQLSQDGQVQPSRTPPQTSMAHGQQISFQGQVGGTQRQGHFHQFSQISPQQTLTPHQGSGQEMLYNQTYFQSENSFKGSYQGNSRKDMQAAPGMSNAMDSVNNGLQTFVNEQQDFGQHSSDFF